MYITYVLNDVYNVNNFQTFCIVNLSVSTFFNFQVINEAKTLFV